MGRRKPILPDFITVENAHGFSAYIHEIGYSYLPSNFYGWGNTMHPVYCMYGTSGLDYMTLPIPHSNLSAIDYDTIYRCLGDTLALLVEHNPDSVPVEWIVNGVSHVGDGYSFLLTALDTLAVQCVLHYECPDTTTTFVAVVPPPLITVAHDTTVCAGATLSVEQPGALSYLWSNGATTPSITVDSAGTFQVAVTNIDYEHCAQELYLPNAFTPGADALNPVFLPVFSYPDEIEEYRMEIYNRWGTLVFRTEEKTFGWDGANAMSGVYAVIVRYKTRGEAERTVKGSVTVVR